MPENKDKTQENKCESKFLETPRTEEDKRKLKMRQKKNIQMKNLH